jgi:hypothetical protein
MTDHVFVLMLIGGSLLAGIAGGLLALVFEWLFTRAARRGDVNQCDGGTE